MIEAGKTSKLKVYVALAVLIVLWWGSGRIWQDGYDQGKAVADEAISQGQQQNEIDKQQDAEREKEVVTEYIEVERIVYRDGKTIIQKVPEYVTVEASAACTVPMGFVSLHDQAIRAANMGQKVSASGTDTASATAEIALPVPEWVDLPAGLSLQEIERVSLENTTAFSVLKNRFEKLAHWSQTQCYGQP